MGSLLYYHMVSYGEPLLRLFSSTPGLNMSRITGSLRNKSFRVTSSVHPSTHLYTQLHPVLIVMFLMVLWRKLGVIRSQYTLYCQLAWLVSRSGLCARPSSSPSFVCRRSSRSPRTARPQSGTGSRWWSLIRGSMFILMTIYSWSPLSPGIRPSRVLSLISQAQWDPTTVLGRGMKCWASPNPYLGISPVSSSGSANLAAFIFRTNGFQRTFQCDLPIDLNRCRGLIEDITAAISTFPSNQVECQIFYQTRIKCCIVFAKTSLYWGHFISSHVYIQELSREREERDLDRQEKQNSWRCKKILRH